MDEACTRDDITLARELKGASNLWGICVGAEMILRQGCTNSLQIYESNRNSRRQCGNMKHVRY
jgi:hypothetical protein